MKICLAQIKVIPANPQANLKKILECIEKAKNDKAEMIVFPEMCVPGYLLGDMWERETFLADCMSANRDIVSASDNIFVAWGNIDIDINKKNEDGRVRKYNCCFVAKDGKMVHRSIKTLQPNYREFDDNRHFYDQRKLMFDEVLSFKQPKLFTVNDLLLDVYSPAEIGNTNISFFLCEDGWSNDYTFAPVDFAMPISKMVVNISCSPYTQGKNGKRNRVFGGKSKQYGKPLVYVNCVGVQNNGKTVYTFDGNSCIYDKFGNQLNPYKPFEEGCETFDIDLDGAFGDPNYKEPEEIQMIHDSVVYALKEFCNQIGIKKVVIGASGGIDSAVVSALFSKILPPENMLLVNMPSSHNSKMTKNAAEQLAKNIGCPYKIIPIQESVDLTKKQLRAVGLDLTSFAVENVQARDRSSRILAACSSAFGGPFTCNANKSESTVGYTTLYGDLGGFIAPLADLWKTQVYELANYINLKANKELIPMDSIKVKPSAELSPNQDVTKGLGDPIIYPYHDKLFSAWVERWNRATPEDILVWYEQDLLEQEIGWEGNIKDLFKTDKEFIDDLERWWNCYSGLSIAKRIQAPPVVASSRRAFGFDHRESQMPPYYSMGYQRRKQAILERK